MVKELIYILMEQSMKESGLRTNSMVWGRKIGQIAPSIQVVMRWVKSMEKDFLYGVMGAPMTENSKIIIFKGREYIHGQMDENT